MTVELKRWLEPTTKKYGSILDEENDMVKYRIKTVQIIITMAQKQ